MTTAATVGRAALLGLTTGARSFSGLAAQVAVTPGLSHRQPERTFGRLRVKALVGLVALGELVGDKLPTAPSRLSPPVLVPRVLLAATTAVLVARARDSSAYVAVPVAVASCLVAAFSGYRWRQRASRTFGRDWPGAVLEDAVALTVAAVATRP